MVMNNKAAPYKIKLNEERHQTHFVSREHAYTVDPRLIYNMKLHHSLMRWSYLLLHRVQNQTRKSPN